MSELARRIAARVTDAASAYHRLVFVVGPAESGKTAALQALAREHAWPLVNVNLELSGRLLELTSRQRTLRAPRLLGEIAERHPGEVLLLDNTEILFAAELQQDPLRMFQGMSRNRIVVAVWSGHVDDDQLVYATPGHPEHRRCRRPEALIVTAIDTPICNDPGHTTHDDPAKEIAP
jgi:hypothetical protein